MVFKIAITGGTSSGKSFISDILSKKLNCLTFDADIMVNEIYKDQNFCNLNFINHESFSQFLNDHQTLCKKKLKEAIIENNVILNQICEIIYPELRQRIVKIFEQFKNEKDIIFEVAMLFESNFNKLFNFIINIESDQDLQLKRSINKKIDSKFHKIFIDRQLHNDIKTQKANFNIINNEDLERQINQCIHIIQNFHSYRSSLDTIQHL